VPIGYGEGMKKARLATGLRLNRTVSQGLMAEIVTAELKAMGFSEKTVSQSVWSQYESEGSEPGLIIIKAAARVSGLSEAEIAFGARADGGQLKVAEADTRPEYIRLAEKYGVGIAGSDEPPPDVLARLQQEEKKRVAGGGRSASPRQPGPRRPRKR
jgi:hypothetical protein